MAALIRHGLLANPLKSTSGILAVSTASIRHDITRNKSKKKFNFRIYPKLEATKKSIASTGFLRPQKPYDPPHDVSDRITAICKSQAVAAADGTRLDDPLVRFNLLVACERELSHYVPNSLLYSIKTIGDLREFYQKPVDSKTPLEMLRSLDLPKNLHIRTEYHRFHPDTDTMFNGKTAFPKSSTLVTGLKYKKKYPGHQQDDPYLDAYLKI